MTLRETGQRTGTGVPTKGHPHITSRFGSHSRPGTQVLGASVGDRLLSIPFAEAACPVCACPQDAPAGWYERGPTDDCPDPSCPCHDYAAMVAP